MFRLNARMCAYARLRLPWWRGGTHSWEVGSRVLRISSVEHNVFLVWYILYTSTNTHMTLTSMWLNVAVWCVFGTVVFAARWGGISERGGRHRQRHCAIVASMGWLESTWPQYHVIIWIEHTRMPRAYAISIPWSSYVYCCHLMSFRFQHDALNHHPIRAISFSIFCMWSMVISKQHWLAFTITSQHQWTD